MLRTGLSWGERVFYWVVILGLLFALVTFWRASLPVAIFVNGEPVAWLSNSRLAQRAIQLAREKMRKQYGQEVDFAETIDVGSLKLPSGRSLSSPAEASDLLLLSVSPAQRAWVIKVADQTVAALRNKEEAEQALELVKAHFTPANVTLVKPPRFKEKVTVQESKVAVGEIVADAETAAQKLIGGLEQPKYHIVKSGEVAVRIARKYGLTLEELKQLNPDKNLDRLKIGDKLLIKRGKPVLTVICIYQVVREEPVPFKVERRFAPSLPGGALVTKQRGREGVKEVVYEVTAENGLEVHRKVVKEKVLKEPVNEVILVGGGLR
ncbi:MAG: G5 domain-containing protein [Armatimonadetes bacterium]|nr:G5 domain-containing protein [Armatimonadota bacterium]MCX7967683.1 G5 domain-containing protein [Armatimonadota bacterium]MDW8142676.1 G5 domain-containing protein [Armatimonadota bacterium]